MSPVPIVAAAVELRDCMIDCAPGSLSTPTAQALHRDLHEVQALVAWGIHLRYAFVECLVGQNGSHINCIGDFALLGEPVEQLALQMGKTLKEDLHYRSAYQGLSFAETSSCIGCSLPWQYMGEDICAPDCAFPCETSNCSCA